MHRTRPAALAALLALACSAPPRQAAPDAAASGPAGRDTARTAGPTVPAASGERRLVYVPVHTRARGAEGTREIPLSVTLTVHNTDPERPLTVSSVRLYDAAGRLVRSHLAAPARLAPLATTSVAVASAQAGPGPVAAFLVEWTGDGVTEPVVEAVMVGTALQQGISWVSAGRTLARP